MWDGRGGPRGGGAPRRFPCSGACTAARRACACSPAARLPGRPATAGCRARRATGRAWRIKEEISASATTPETELQNLARPRPLLARSRTTRRERKGRSWRWRAPKVYGYQKEFFGYPGAGGYLAHFPRDPEAGAALVEGLKNTSWISANTRAVFFEAVVYAPADHWGYNLLVEVALNAEFSPTGAVVTSGRVQSSRIFLYDTWRDFVRLVLEVLVVLYVWYFEMREEVQQITLKALSGDAAQSEIKALREWRRNFASALGEYWNAHFNFLDVMRIHACTCGSWASTSAACGSRRPSLARPHVRPATRACPGRGRRVVRAPVARVRMMFVALYVALCFLAAQYPEVQGDLFVIIIIEMAEGHSSDRRAHHRAASRSSRSSRASAGPRRP